MRASGIFCVFIFLVFIHHGSQQTTDGITTLDVTNELTTLDVTNELTTIDVTTELTTIDVTTELITLTTLDVTDETTTIDVTIPNEETTPLETTLDITMETTTSYETDITTIDETTTDIVTSSDDETTTAVASTSWKDTTFEGTTQKNTSEILTTGGPTKITNTQETTENTVLTTATDLQTETVFTTYLSGTEIFTSTEPLFTSKMATDSPKTTETMSTSASETTSDAIDPTDLQTETVFTTYLSGTEIFTSTETLFTSKMATDSPKTTETLSTLASESTSDAIDPTDLQTEIFTTYLSGTEIFTSTEPLFTSKMATDSPKTTETLSTSASESTSDAIDPTDLQTETVFTTSPSETESSVSTDASFTSKLATSSSKVTETLSTIGSESPPDATDLQTETMFTTYPSGTEIFTSTETSYTSELASSSAKTTVTSSTLASESTSYATNPTDLQTQTSPSSQTEELLTTESSYAPTTGGTDSPNPTETETIFTTYTTNTPASIATDTTTLSSTATDTTETVMTSVIQTEIVSTSFTTTPSRTASTERVTTNVATTDTSTDVKTTPTLTSPTPGFPVVGPLPPDELPQIPDNGETPIIQTIELEVAVIDDCDPNDSSSCEALKETFIIEATSVYQNISGFMDVIVVGLRPGSVIIKHRVEYDYNNMSATDKSLSAMEVFGRTMQEAVDTGFLGNLTLTECTDCEEPTFTGSLCDSLQYATCEDSTLKPYCVDGLIQCQSPCKHEFCQNDGICQHPQLQSPTCHCRQTNNGHFTGENCQIYINTVGAIVGVTVGAFAVLVVIIMLSVCVVQRGRLRKPRVTKSGTISTFDASTSYTDTRSEFETLSLDTLDSIESEKLRPFMADAEVSQDITSPYKIQRPKVTVTNKTLGHDNLAVETDSQIEHHRPRLTLVDEYDGRLNPEAEMTSPWM